MSSDDQSADRPLDEDLSAFLDGELPPDREAAMRLELESNPELARRVRDFRDANEALRALPGRELPGAMYTSLRAAIDSGAPSLRSDQGADAHDPAQGMQAPEVADLAVERRRKILVGVVAAAATIVLMLTSFGNSSLDYTFDGGTQALYEFDEDVPGALDPEGSARPGATAEASPAASDPAIGDEPLPAVFDAVTEEDLVLAVEYETLQDLEVIRDLDLLEALARKDLGGAG